VVGKAFHRVGPIATLDELCDEALRGGKLQLYTNLTDLNRCADDASLRQHHRQAAAKQYERLQAKANDEMRRESRTALDSKRIRSFGSRRCVWTQCDDCLRWRRLDLSPAAASQLPDRWLCSMNPRPPFNRCEVPEEALTEAEHDLDVREATEVPFTAEADRLLVAAVDRARVDGWSAIKRAQALQLASGLSPLSFDLFLKSRTADELQARAEELKMRRLNALMPANTNEGQSNVSELSSIKVLTTEEAPRDEVDHDDAVDGDASEQADDDDVPAVEILKHHVYSGAKPGSLYNVYVRIRSADGSLSGDNSVCMEPSEPLCNSTEGPDVLAEYCRTPRGQSMAKYVPAHILEAGTVLSNVERACRDGAMAAVREAAAVRAAVNSVARPKALVRWPARGGDE
jgi:hypothetical protein